MSEVPRSLTELKVWLGHEILVHEMISTYGCLDDSIQGVIDRAPDWKHIKAADRWRAAFARPIGRFEQLAERALPNLPDRHETALDSIMSDTVGPLMHGDMAELRNSNADIYFGKLFRGVFAASPADAKLCLEALLAFTRGE